MRTTSVKLCFVILGVVVLTSIISYSVIGKYYRPYDYQRDFPRPVLTITGCPINRPAVWCGIPASYIHAMTKTFSAFMAKYPIDYDNKEMKRTDPYFGLRVDIDAMPKDKDALYIIYYCSEFGTGSEGDCLLHFQSPIVYVYEIKKDSIVDTYERHISRWTGTCEFNIIGKYWSCFDMAVLVAAAGSDALFKRHFPGSDRGDYTVDISDSGRAIIIGYFNIKNEKYYKYQIDLLKESGFDLNQITATAYYVMRRGTFRFVLPRTGDLSARQIISGEGWIPDVYEDPSGGH